MFRSARQRAILGDGSTSSRRRVRRQIPRWHPRNRKNGVLGGAADIQPRDDVQDADHPASPSARSNVARTVRSREHTDSGRPRPSRVSPQVRQGDAALSVRIGNSPLRQARLPRLPRGSFALRGHESPRGIPCGQDFRVSLGRGGVLACDPSLEAGKRAKRTQKAKAGAVESGIRHADDQQSLVHSTRYASRRTARDRRYDPRRSQDSRPASTHSGKGLPAPQPGWP